MDSTLLISIFALGMTVLAFVMAVVTLCLQCRGNKIANDVNKQSEKISKHQDRIEFFQKKNHVIGQVKNLELSEESSIKLVNDIEFIFENRFSHIVVKDTEGSFPELSMSSCGSADEADNWINQLKEKIIKIHLIKEGERSYALPSVSEDFERKEGLEMGQIKGLEDEHYYWKNSQITYIPGFLFVIEKIGYKGRNSVESKNERDESIELKHRFFKKATLDTEERYVLYVSKAGKDFRWIIYDFPNHESVRVEVKFVNPNRLEEHANALKAFLEWGH